MPLSPRRPATRTPDRRLNRRLEPLLHALPQRLHISAELHEVAHGQAAEELRRVAHVRSADFVPEQAPGKRECFARRHSEAYRQLSREHKIFDQGHRNASLNPLPPRRESRRRADAKQQVVEGLLINLQNSGRGGRSDGSQGYSRKKVKLKPAFLSPEVQVN